LLILLQTCNIYTQSIMKQFFTDYKYESDTGLNPSLLRILEVGTNLHSSYQLTEAVGKTESLPNLCSTNVNNPKMFAHFSQRVAFLYPLSHAYKRSQY
jgi:hypothetical protein